ncbi:MAG: DUF4276 family protein [Bacteroidales bacterium]|nr:DUF4276 family protein [Bacteroidales bacterium]
MAARQVFVGFTTEGSTDVRFLRKIIERSFEEIAYECQGDVEPVVWPLDVKKTDLSFSEYALKAAQQGVEEIGMMILCIHSDADDATNQNVLDNKIAPARELINAQSDDTTCKILVPAIPVQMMESWMLADKDLLKNEIGTTKTDNELGINRSPESITDPKAVIEEAIRIARQEITRRRRKELRISDLYLPVGQKVSIDKLKGLPSYRRFQEDIRQAYRELHLME